MSSAITKENTNEPRVVCFGSKKFILKTIDDFCKILEGPKDKRDEYFKTHPYGDILEVSVAFCYHKKTNQFYCDVRGGRGGMWGDFQWDVEYALAALRGNNVPECCIPDFLKNHEEIQQRYLEEDLSVIVNDEYHGEPGYHYKKREEYIQEYEYLELQKDQAQHSN